MIESRCGLCCSECSYRESEGCTGCITMKVPFWGEACPIKSCCEEKGLDFCGQCELFPCDKLFLFSYDEEHGDQGKRIEQCRRWVRELEDEFAAEEDAGFQP